MKPLRWKHIVVQAKTKELAIEKALKQLNASPDQIETKVIEEPRKGIFGFFQRDAKVLVECLRPPVERAELFLSECIEKMGLETELEILPSSQANSKMINLKGENLGILIGKRGRTIDALQYLVNLVANQDAKEATYFVLDADGYRKKREKLLVQLAMRTADQVKRERKPIKLDPLPPMERKIIHTVLQDDPEIKTESEGVEPRRAVIIKINDSSN